VAVYNPCFVIVSPLIQKTEVTPTSAAMRLYS
jgi:hypothetical protein